MKQDMWMLSSTAQADRLSCLWTYLEIDDNSEDKDGGDQVHEVGEILAVECLSKGSDLVCAGGQQVEQCDDGTFELHPCGQSRTQMWWRRKSSSLNNQNREERSRSSEKQTTALSCSLLRRAGCSHFLGHQMCGRTATNLNISVTHVACSRSWAVREFIHL